MPDSLSAPRLPAGVDPRGPYEKALNFKRVKQKAVDEHKRAKAQEQKR